MAVVGAGAASLFQIAVPSNAASGQTLESAQAQAAAIASRLSYLGGQVSFLAEKYNQAQLKLSTVDHQVSAQQDRITATEAQITSIRAKLSQEAIAAYVSGGNLPSFSALMSENPTEASIRQEFLNTVTNSQTDLIASFQSANQTLSQQQRVLKTVQAQAVTAFAAVSAAKLAAQAAVNQERTQLGTVNSNIASLVAQQQAVLAQQAAQKARQIVFNAPTATGTNSSSNAGGSHSQVPSSPSPKSTPAASGSQIGIALSWARQELGKPYVFGGAGPNVFDCSGLTSFVYAKAGISLPHSAAAQYSDTSRISLSQLQPGDLVFYYSPISHVAIYLGGGQVLQALNESAPVEVSGLYWDGVPVGAGRVS